MPSKFFVVVAVVVLPKAKPNILHFGEMKVSRCILHETQNQETNDTAQGGKLFGDPVAVQPWQQWCRQPALGYRQPSTERNKQPTEGEN